MKMKATPDANLPAPRISRLSPTSLFGFQASRKNGMTLVLVLGLIALSTILVVSFLTLVSTELVSSKAASNENNATALAATAVQLVEGTIIHATEPRLNGTNDTSQAWACQPGLIRTYGGPTAGVASSSPLAYYKLYSSTNMIVSSPTNNYLVDSDIVGTWDAEPSLFTDLNAPLNAGTSSEIFPIVDPRAADSDINVAGFSYTNMPTMSSAISVDGIVHGTTTSGNDTSSRLPMPVRWFYVLQDGTLTAPGGTTSATWSSGYTSTTGNIPNATNPIVGRIAFWTDDECGKVNINTASEGTFNDTPICNATNCSSQPFGTTNSYCGDFQLATLPGVQDEYQRYPGHPATTCLSTVLGNILGANLTHAQIVQAITDATPRVSEYGADGTTIVSSLGGSLSNNIANDTSPTPVTPDRDRLYANVDEYAFKTSSSTNRAPQTFTGTTNSALTVAETCRFFLTANSKAPELNLFGLPRISMWPIWNDTYSTSRTTLDNEILRCATVATTFTNSGYGHPMIFSRYDSTSPTNDFSPLNTLDGQPRNQQLYGYLQALTSRPVPGYAASSTDTFAKKYGTTDRDQILTEMFDYIRCTDIQDVSTGASSYTGIYASGNYGGQNTNQSPAAPGNSPGQVVPIQITAPTTGTVTQGFGRIAMVSELALVLIKVDDRVSKSTSDDYYNANSALSHITLTNTIIGTDPNSSQAILHTSGATYTPGVASNPQTLFEWVLLPKLDSVACGYSGIANNIRIHFSSINLTIADTGYTVGATVNNGYSANINVANNVNTYPDIYDVGHISSDRDAVIGGVMGAEALLDNSTASMTPTGLFLANSPSFNSTFPGGNGTLTVGGTVTVQIFAPNTAKTPIQTLTFTFPSTINQAKHLTTGYPAPIPNIDDDPPSTNIGAVYQWYGTFRASPTNYVASATNAKFYYPPITTGADALSGTAYKNTSYRIGGNEYHWLGGSAVAIPPTNVVFVAGTAGTDVIRGLNTGGQLNGLNIQGDLRMLATTNNVPTSVFTLAPVVSGSTAYAPTNSISSAAVGSLRLGLNFSQPGYAQGKLMTNAGSYGDVPAATLATNAATSTVNNSYTLINGVTMAGDNTSNTNYPGDWDNGEGLMVDGPYINKPDEGMSYGGVGVGAGGGIPYIGGYQMVQGSAAQLPGFFAPNRIVSSPVMFGSLTVGQDHPWRTLLFRPARLPGYDPLVTNGASYTHPGYSSPSTTLPDHLLLDLFWMPVVEPYGISEPFATAGKINLNYQIAPFTYITRNTGMQAVLKSVMVTGLSPNQSGGGLAASFSGNYKRSVDYGTAYNQGWANNNISRYAIDPNATLNQMTPTSYDSTNNVPEFTRPKHSSTAPNFFVSASKICDVPLIPAVPSFLGGPYTASTLGNFWTNNCLTGDNELERPYSFIYPRVTTQSNVFTVHVRAQSLKQTPGDLSAGTWTEGTDLITGEFRGSFVIEKYFDPDNANITYVSGGTVTTNSAANDATISTGAAVRGAKWRILSMKRYGQ